MPGDMSSLPGASKAPAGEALALLKESTGVWGDRENAVNEC